MIQFYCLAVTLNVITGLILIYLSDDKDVKSSLFDNEIFRLVVGILSCLVGFIKLFFVYGSKVVIVGDLLPAIAGMAGGFVLVAEYFYSRQENENVPDFVDNFFFAYKKYIGIVCILIGIIHFVIPGFIVF